MWSQNGALNSQTSRQDLNIATGKSPGSGVGKPNPIIIPSPTMGGDRDRLAKSYAPLSNVFAFDPVISSNTPLTRAGQHSLSSTRLDDSTLINSIQDQTRTLEKVASRLGGLPREPIKSSFINYSERNPNFSNNNGTALESLIKSQEDDRREMLRMMQELKNENQMMRANLMNSMILSPQRVDSGSNATNKELIEMIKDLKRDQEILRNSLMNMSSMTQLAQNQSFQQPKQSSKGDELDKFIMSQNQMMGEFIKSMNKLSEAALANANKPTPVYQPPPQYLSGPGAQHLSPSINGGYHVPPYYDNPSNRYAHTQRDDKGPQYSPYIDGKGSQYSPYQDRYLTHRDEREPRIPSYRDDPRFNSNRDERDPRYQDNRDPRYQDNRDTRYRDEKDNRGGQNEKNFGKPLPQNAGHMQQSSHPESRDARLQPQQNDRFPSQQNDRDFKAVNSSRNEAPKEQFINPTASDALPNNANQQSHQPTSQSNNYATTPNQNERENPDQRRDNNHNVPVMQATPGQNMSSNENTVGPKRDFEEQKSILSNLSSIQADNRQGGTGLHIPLADSERPTIVVRRPTHRVSTFPIEQQLRLKAKFKNLLWVWGSQVFLLQYARNLSTMRRKVVEEYYDRAIPEVETAILDILDEDACKIVYEIIDHKQLIELRPKQEAKKASVQKNIKFLMTKLELIITSFISTVEEDQYKHNVIIFLGLLSRPNTFIPDEYVSEFELERLNFNQFGRLRDFTRDRQLMMIGVQILLRTMVYQAVLRPKPREDQKLELNENSKANVMLFASVLYHIIIGIWRRIPSDPGSQNHLRKLDKVKPGAPLFVADSGSRRAYVSSQEVINGLIKVEDLGPIFKEKNSWVNERRREILEALLKLSDKVDGIWKDSLIYPKVKTREAAKLGTRMFDNKIVGSLGEDDESIFNS